MTSCATCPPQPQVSAHQGFAARTTGALTRYIATAFSKLVEWQERAEQRHYLAAMDERMRKDIGVSHADAVREADKPFWRA